MRAPMRTLLPSRSAAILLAILMLAGCGQSGPETNPAAISEQAVTERSTAPMTLAKPTAWKNASALNLAAGRIAVGDTEASVRNLVGEPRDFEVPRDPDVRIELESETVNAIKKIDTFFVENRWFRISMHRKVPRRPYVVKWIGYEQPATFVVYRIEVPRDSTPVQAIAVQQAQEPEPAFVRSAEASTRAILNAGVSVESITVRGSRIGVGDLSDDTVSIAKASDRIAKPFIRNDPALPGSLVVTQTFSIAGRRFCLEFKRDEDPGPFRVSRILISE